MPLGATPSTVMGSLRDGEAERIRLCRMKAREILSVGSGFVSIYRLHPETAGSKLLPSGGA